MIRAAYAFTFLCLCPGFVSAREAPARAPQTLRAYVAGLEGRQAYGLYLLNQKVGWLVEETRIGELKGSAVAIETEESYIVLKLGREKSVRTMKGRTCYALEGDGPVVFAEERTTDDGDEIVRTVVPEDKGLAIITRTRTGQSRRHVGIPKDTLALNRRLDHWLNSNPAPGATFENYSTSWEDAEIDQKEIVTYRGKKWILWGGVRTEAFQVRLEIQGAKMDAELKADGTPLRSMLGGLLEIRAEDEVAAKKLDGKDVDMLAASEVRADKPLGDPENLRSLTLEVSEAGDFQFPTSHRQRARSEKDKIILELFPDYRVDRPLPLAKDERARYLAATPTVQSDAERVRKLARQIVGSEQDPVKAAALLEHWVHRKLRKSMAANASTALQVLDNLAGDCTEHTLLFVTLARAAGIPAREVGGLVYPDIGRPVFGWHAWAEIHDGRQWVSIDPTWGQVFVDASHIKFQEGSDDFSWMNVAGKLKLKVRDFKTFEPPAGSPDRVPRPVK